jgi:hypothetical protein
MTIGCYKPNWSASARLLLDHPPSWAILQVPDASSLEEHGEIAVLADLEDRSVQRGGEGGEGPGALNGSTQLERRGRDALDRAEGEQEQLQTA